MTKKTESKKKTINDFKPKEHKLDIKHPVTGKDIGGWLTIVGSYSKEFYQAAKNVLRNKDLVEVDFEVTEEENSKTIAACIVGWDDDFFQQEFSQEGALELMSNPEFGWIRVQVEAAIHVRSNFF